MVVGRWMGGNYGKKENLYYCENHELLEGIAQQFEKFSIIKL